MTPEPLCPPPGTATHQQLAAIIKNNTPLADWCAALNTNPTHLHHLIATISERRQQ